MADDVRIKYGSSGFERVRKELRDLEAIGATSGTWFKSMQKSVKEAEAAHTSFGLSAAGSLQSVASVAGGLSMAILKIGTVVTAVSGIVAGVGVAAFTKWSMSVMQTTERFKMLEISLYGATKSWEAVNKVSEFAKKYAAEFPAMYGDIMQAMQSFSYIPALKPMIMKGDVEEMHKMMTIIQGLMTMRPDQGVQGAIYALREALAGNWRTLQARFDVPIASIAKSAGMTLQEMKASPGDAVKALKSFVDEFVGADTMAMMAKNLSIQLGNLKDKYEMWIDKLGKTGVYQKVVDYLLKLNDAQERFMSSDRFKNWTEQINKFLEDVVDGIAGVFTKGIDWESIATMGELGEAMKKVGQNAIEELKKVWEAAKEPLADALKGVFRFVGKAAAEAFKEALLPAMKEIESGLRKSMDEYGKENPVKASLARMGMGSGLGFLAAGPKGLLLGPALEALKGYGELLGLVLEKGGKGFSAIEGGLKSVMGTVTEGADKLTKVPYENLAAMRGEYEQLRGVLEQAGKQFGAQPEKADKRAEDMKKWMSQPFKGWSGSWSEPPGERPLSESEIERIIWGDYWKKRAAQHPTVEEAGEWKPKAKSELDYYSSWSRMAKAMAERDETERLSFSEQEDLRRKEYATVREKWDYGQISGEDWGRYAKKFDAETTKRMRLEDFGKERDQKLSTILNKAIEEKDIGVQGRVYSEMFNIAYQKGDFGAAQEYMNKSLDVMVEQMKKAEKYEEQNSENLSGINEHTLETVELLKAWQKGEGQYGNISRAARDELVDAVRAAIGES